MPTSRNPRQEYTSPYLSDRDPIEPSIRIDDADGNPVDISADNPMPVSSSLPDLQEVLTINVLLGRLLDETIKTNLYLAEMIGDKFDETD